MSRIPASRTIMVLLIIILAACVPQPQTAPTSAPTNTAAVSPAITSAPTEQIPTATATQALSPSAEGELLIVNTTQGLWTARPDGTEGALRIAGPLIIPGPLAGALSSVDGNFAYLTTSDFTRAYGNYPNLTLNIMSLFGRGPFVSLPLTSPETEPGTEFPSDIIRAMVEHPSFAWSPEGTRLAYIGAAQGPSADVYEYIRGTGDVLRLTDGPDQAYDPVWSPDGKWVVHAAAAGFGTGAGIAVTGMYAARPDGSGTISLYGVSEHSGGEEAVGWLNDHTLVAYTWFATCGSSDLRLVDLIPQTADLVFEGCLSAAAVGGGSVLFAQPYDMTGSIDNPQPGLYIITEDNRSPRQINDTNVREIVWAEGIGAFLVRLADSYLLEISPAGGIRLLADSEPMIPTVSPDGRFWALADASYPDSPSGVWIGEYGQALRRIFADKISPNQILFMPPGNSLLFLDAAGNLYRANAPDWEPILLAADLQPASSDLSLAFVPNDNWVF